MNYYVLGTRAAATMDQQWWISIWKWWWEKEVATTTVSYLHYRIARSATRRCGEGMIDPLLV